MTLILQTTSTRGNSSGQTLEYEFHKDGGSIGRSGSNIWVLPDEQKYLSSKHALVTYTNGEYTLTDTSTNGVFINRSSYPLGRNNVTRLRNGDNLRMGAYDISVILTDNTPSDEKAHDVANNDFFSDLDNDFASPKANKSTDPLSENIAPSRNPIFDSDDPFADLLSGKSSSQDVVNNDATPQQDILGENFKPMPIVESEAESVSLPKNQTTQEADDFLQGFDSTPQEPDDSPKQAWTNDWFKSDSPESNIDDLFSGLGGSQSQKPETVTETPAQKEPTPCPETSKAKVQAAPERNEQKPKKADEAVHIPHDAIAQFIDGLGLEDTALQSKISAQLDFKAVGKLFRTSVQGTMDVLHSRTDIKNELRMDATTIQPIQNNPLKFAINVEDALTRLLTPQKETYLPSQKALTEAYDDIRAHQIAIIAGIQAALSHMLKRFEPEKLGIRLEKNSPIAANIPLHRQAKLWSLFEDLYDTIQREAEDDFSRLFGLEFAKAYDKQIDELKNTPIN